MLLQFMAEPAEIAQWVQSWKEQKDLAMAVLLDRFAASYQNAATVTAQDVAGGGAVLVLSPAPLRVDVPANRFVESNEDLFVVDLGKRTPEALRESAIRTTASSPEVDKVWWWAINRAKKSMHKGATVVTSMGTEGPINRLYLHRRCPSRRAAGRADAGLGRRQRVPTALKTQRRS